MWNGACLYHVLTAHMFPIMLYYIIRSSCLLCLSCELTSFIIHGRYPAATGQGRHRPFAFTKADLVNLVIYNTSIIKFYLSYHWWSVSVKAHSFWADSSAVGFSFLLGGSLSALGLVALIPVPTDNCLCLCLALVTVAAVITKLLAELVTMLIEQISAASVLKPTSPALSLLFAGPYFSPSTTLSLPSLCLPCLPLCLSLLRQMVLMSTHCEP